MHTEDAYISHIYVYVYMAGHTGHRYMFTSVQTACISWPMNLMQLTLFKIMLPNRRGVCLPWWESDVANSRLKHPKQHLFPFPYTPNCMCHWVSLHCFLLQNPQVMSPTYKLLISQFQNVCCFYPRNLWCSHLHERDPPGGFLWQTHCYLFSPAT